MRIRTQAGTSRACSPPRVTAISSCYASPATDPLLSRITSKPGIFGGKPIIRGQRFAVQHLLDYLASGMIEAELLADLPFLEADDIRAALLYAGRLAGMTPMSGASVGAAYEHAGAVD